VSARRPASGRVAIVTHTHPSLSKGGAEIAAYSLFTGLLRLGIDAFFVAACPQSDEGRIVLGSAREKAVFYAPERYESFYHLSPGPVIDQLRAVLRAERIALVNFHHFLNIGINAVRAVAVERGMTTVLTFHEFLAICHHHGQMVTHPDRRLCESSDATRCAACFPEFSRQQFLQRRQLMLETLDQVGGFISPSRFLADRMTEWGLPRERIEVIDNGLRLEKPTRRPCQFNPEASCVFGFFGQITPFKGVDVLLDAAEILAHTPALAERVRIRIFGNFVGLADDFLSRFQTLVKALPLLDYAGPYANEDVQELMGECHYVIVPSTWWENSPLVIQEASVAGCPVICPGIGGLGEKVRHDKSGLYFRRGDGADLARVISEAMDEVVLAKLRAGLPARRDSLTMAREYLDAFDRFAARRGRSDERRGRLVSSSRWMA